MFVQLCDCTEELEMFVVSGRKSTQLAGRTHCARALHVSHAHCTHRCAPVDHLSSRCASSDPWHFVFSTQPLQSKEAVQEGC